MLHIAYTEQALPTGGNVSILDDDDGTLTALVNEPALYENPYEVLTEFGEHVSAALFARVALVV